MKGTGDLLFVFSACGGICTGMRLYASFDSLLSRAGLGRLGKGLIVRDTTTRYIALLQGSRALLPKLEQVVPIYSLSGAVWPTAKH